MTYNTQKESCVEKTTLFYDIETTGLNPCFDQVIEFAGIICDKHLRPLEHIETCVKINSDTLPSPEAMITHQIPLEKIASGVNEYAFMQMIHQKFNQPHTISVGYNNLSFDDEFMRFGFYRNLLTPYTHQYANGCGRLDIYPMTVMNYLYSQGSAVRWPHDDDGTPRLKLDRLNEVNQWVDGASHLAMNDVKATIALAKALKEDQKLWNYCLGYFNKQKSQQRLRKLPLESLGSLKAPLALLIDGRYGFKNHFQHAALLLGQHRHYKNQDIWLVLDMQDFEAIDQSTWQEEAWTVRKKANETPFFLPLNRHYGQYISNERWALIESNLRTLKDHPVALQKLQMFFLHQTYDPVVHIDPDGALYQSPFPTHQEQNLLNNFHDSSTKLHLQWQSMPSELNQQRALRVIGRHFTHSLHPKDQTLWQTHLQGVFSPTDTPPLDWKGQPRRSYDDIMQAIQDLKSTHDSQLAIHQILVDLEHMLKQRYETIHA